MSVILVATVLPVAEHRDEVVATFERAIARVHAEDEGCELYALHTGRDRLVMIEKWSDRDALGRHGKSAALAELTASLTGKIVGEMDVQVLRPHPAGTPDQGTL